LGGLRGWFLHVDDQYQKDYYNSTARKVVLHKTSKTKWNIYTYNNGESKISVANGPYRGWILTCYG